METEIIAQLETKEEVDRLMIVVDKLIEAGYRTKGRGQEEVGRGLPGRVVEKLRQGLSQTGSAPVDFLEKLRQDLSKLKVVKLIIAFEPEAEMVERWLGWIRQWVGEGVVAEIRSDKRILGGAVVEWAGKYRDLSLKSRLEEYFRDEKSKGEVFDLIAKANSK